jgi:formylglycine-generating enzyme required for sulfatase activity
MNFPRVLLMLVLLPGALAHAGDGCSLSFSFLNDGFEPYLSRLSSRDRQAVQTQIIDPGLASPLSTGEVQFQFRGDHTFIVGKESFYGRDQGSTEETSFGEGDSFRIGQVPVTQFLFFLAALGDFRVDPTPSHFRYGEGAVALRLGHGVFHFKPNHPVENVSYSQAQEHADRVSRLTGERHQLPTERQWEFASRAGSTDLYPFGADANEQSKYGWFRENSGSQTHAVGQLSPNAFGLYDMQGNVGEWTSSRYGLMSGIRGGSWDSDAQYLRSGYRSFVIPGYRTNNNGFRLVRTIPLFTR